MFTTITVTAALEAAFFELFFEVFFAPFFDVFFELALADFEVRFFDEVAGRSDFRARAVLVFLVPFLATISPPSG
jgi:hypothetical protein